ncbi:MAG: hypothetical protein J6U98_00995 [Abditibacteriota bacterium]|nr:hypothetical protein [Abditibacteriota bacterium]MBP5738977.1 hypothetical protein [Abditibacteriota bacterium]
MKKLILLFAVAAALCASTVFAATVYHATTPEEFFAAISYDADTINALSVGIACLGGDMGVWPTNSMHWVEGTDQYGDYLLGTLSATDTLATGAPALYFSNHSGAMSVEGTDVYKPAGTVLVGMPNGADGDWIFDVFITNTSDIPVLVNGSVVFTPATVFDFDTYEASDYEWDISQGVPSEMMIRSWPMGDATRSYYFANVDSGWSDMDPIEIDSSNPGATPSTDDATPQYTENYTDYELQPGQSMHWELMISGYHAERPDEWPGGSYGYTWDSSLGNYFSLGLDLNVTKYSEEPEPEPTELPEPSAFAYGALGLVSALGMKRRTRK